MAQDNQIIRVSDGKQLRTDHFQIVHHTFSLAWGEWQLAPCEEQNVREKAIAKKADNASLSSRRLLSLTVNTELVASLSPSRKSSRRAAAGNHRVEGEEARTEKRREGATSRPRRRENPHGLKKCGNSLSPTICPWSFLALFLLSPSLSIARSLRNERSLVTFRMRSIRVRA